MRIAGKILMIIATFIVVAHTVVPHQHKVQLEAAFHECFFSDSHQAELSNIFQKLEDIIKHVNLGEKHLENFRTSSYEYDFSHTVVTIFQPQSILDILKFKLQGEGKINHIFYYNSTYTSCKNKLRLGLRAPPCI